VWQFQEQQGIEGYDTFEWVRIGRPRGR
jgi:hypothetical protein